MLIEYHRTMIADAVRNDAFRRALEKVVEKGKTVVADIGAGTGIMGFFARRLGAQDVYLYEYGNIADVGAVLAEGNGIDRCHFIKAHSTEIENPPMVDVIVSETLGNYAFEEHIISTVMDAKRFLKPGGAIIPQQVRHFVAPVTAARFYDELRAWDKAGAEYGLDFAAAQAMSLNNIYVRSFRPDEVLAAREWDHADFRAEDVPSDRAGRAAWTLDAAATVYGFAVWWRCTLAAGVELGTGPDDPRTHWEQLFFPLLTPLDGRAGDSLTVDLASRTSYEDGTILDWTTTLRRAGDGEETQSQGLTMGYID